MDITNLVLSAVQSITLVTNVASGDNAINNPNNLSWLVEANYVNFNGQIIPTSRTATEKWTTTNVFAEFTLSFDWVGQRREVKHSVPVWGVTNRYKLKEEWERVESKSDDPSVIVSGTVVWTNSISVAPLVITNVLSLDNGGWGRSPFKP